MSDNLQLSDKEIIEHSKANPNEVFTCDDGRVVHCGVFYKNEKQFVETVGILSKPGVSKFLMFLARVFYGKKPKKN